MGKTHIKNVKKIHNFFSAKKATAGSPAVDTHQSYICGSNQQTIDGAITYASVVNAEIRWALKCEIASYSNNSNRTMPDLFLVIFADSPTPQLQQSIRLGLASCVTQLSLVWVLFLKGSLCTIFKTLIITV